MKCSYNESNSFASGEKLSDWLAERASCETMQAVTKMIIKLAVFMISLGNWNVLSQK